MTSAPELEMEKAMAFGDKMLGFLNGWSRAMCISVGHRTGLFDTMAGLAPSSSRQIADAASLHERYVREWLHALVVAGVIEYDQARTYTLPPEHAAATTRAAGPHNVASMMTMFPMLAGVEDELVEAFTSGAGIPYDSFPAFAA